MYEPASMLRYTHTARLVEFNLRHAVFNFIFQCARYEPTSVADCG